MSDDEFSELKDPMDPELDIVLQREDAEEIRRPLVNLKKDPRLRRTEKKFTAYPSKADKIWMAMTDRHKAISVKAQTSTYIQSDAYGEAGQCHLNILDVVNKEMSALGRSESEAKKLEPVLSERAKKLAVLSRFIEVHSLFEQEEPDKEEISYLKKKLTVQILFRMCRVQRKAQHTPPFRVKLHSVRHIWGQRRRCPGCVTNSAKTHEQIWGAVSVQDTN